LRVPGVASRRYAVHLKASGVHIASLATNLTTNPRKPMSPVPPQVHSLAAEIYRWHQANADDGLRPHLGASLIGHPCARYLWLSFRWVMATGFEGRILRLFARGQREEAIIVEELRGIGAEVSECQANGDQWRVSACGGHFGGSLDGCVKGLPGGSATNWELLEFKTHNAKSFKDLSEKGVQVSKPQHWCQMQTYLHLTGMTRANYIAVNKDTEALYHERVAVDPEAGPQLIKRAESVIFAQEPPPGISSDPSWFQCRMCSYHAFCHGQEAPLVTCRSCAHVTPDPQGGWKCERFGHWLTISAQKEACAQHRYIPALLSTFAVMVDADASENWVEYRNLATNALFMNCGTVYRSADIHGCQDKRQLVVKEG
jgi:hypothetical protein